jgi:hypothetical protein
VTGTQRHPLLTFLCWQAVGLVLLFCHLGLIVIFGNVVVPLAITAILVALLYFTDSMAGFAVFLQFLLYQNVAISVLSGSLSPELFHAAQGTGFALTLTVTAIAACRLWLSGRDHNVLIYLGAAGLVILAYTALGAERSSLGSAAVYFRSSSVALSGLLIGWDVGRDNDYRAAGLCFLMSMGVGLMLALLEVTVPAPYYSSIGATRYYSLTLAAATSRVSVDFSSAGDLVSFLTSSFFNVVGGWLQTVRFGGPNMHSVSYAYVLAIGALVALSLGIYWFAAATLPFLFLIGVKGGAVLLFATVLLSLVGRLFGCKVLIVSGLCAAFAYVTFALWYGLSVGDYHVIGLLAGLNGFLQNPLGHGIGVGGNLSVDVTSRDLGKEWDLNQRYGAEVPLESAIGVLLYQMGVGATAVAYTIWTAFRSSIHHLKSDTGLVPLSITVVTVNGLLQEEAFSPYALGLLALFAGVLSRKTTPKTTWGKNESRRASRNGGDTHPFAYHHGQSLCVEAQSY